MRLKTRYIVLEYESVQHRDTFYNIVIECENVQHRDTEMIHSYKI